MAIEISTDERQEVTIHRSRNPVPNVREEHIEVHYNMNLDNLALQASLYQSLQEIPRPNNQYNASGSGSRSSPAIGQSSRDEVIARQYQLLEEMSAVAPVGVLHDSGENTPESSISAMNGGTALRSTHGELGTQDDIIPDNMSYEQLQSLGEEMGNESRGLPDELITFLRPLEHSNGFFSKRTHGECVICQSSYKKREKLMTLPCKHCYHKHCIIRWLKENKACPVCKEEVFG